MFTTSIAHTLQFVLQYIALIVALTLCLWIKDSYRCFRRAHMTPTYHSRRNIERPLVHDKRLLNLYQWIRNYRQVHHMSQEKFAEKLGVSPRTIGRWEKGTKPQPRHYKKLQQLNLPKAGMLIPRRSVSIVLLLLMFLLLLHYIAHGVDVSSLLSLIYQLYRR